jgi:hypothetical protein
MDPIATLLAGCVVYGGYKLYKLLSSPSYHCFLEEGWELEGTPVYTFELIKTIKGTTDIEQITSNVILKNKTKLVEAIKFALTEYGSCTSINSFVFYYDEIPLVQLIVSSKASTNVLVRLPRNPSWTSKRFTIVNNKQYNFEGPIPETYDVSLTKKATLNISKHIGLYNYPIFVDELKKEHYTFAGVSEIVFTYYNIPIVKLNILGQEDKLSSLVMDLA